MLWNRANYLYRVSAEMKPPPIKRGIITRGLADNWLLLVGVGVLIFIDVSGIWPIADPRSQAFLNFIFGGFLPENRGIGGFDPSGDPRW